LVCADMPYQYLNVWVQSLPPIGIPSHHEFNQFHTCCGVSPGLIEILAQSACELSHSGFKLFVVVEVYFKLVHLSFLAVVAMCNTDASHFRVWCSSIYELQVVDDVLIHLLIAVIAYTIVDVVLSNLSWVCV